MRSSLPRVRVAKPVNKKWAEQLIADNPQLAIYDPVKIVREFNEFLVAKLTSYRDGVLLPANLGHLFMGVFPNKNNSFIEERAKRDHEAIARGARNVVYSNQQRDGFESRLFHSTAFTKSRCKSSRYYGLKPLQKTNKIVEDAFTSNWKKWVVVPDLRKLKEFSRLENYGNKMIRKERELEAYDEFAFDKKD